MIDLNTERTVKWVHNEVGSQRESLLSIAITLSTRVEVSSTKVEVFSVPDNLSVMTDISRLYCSRK